jgi:hypothetical protein
VTPGTGAPRFLRVTVLASLDRDALADALFSLLDQGAFDSQAELVAPVTELVLEHIGVVWRSRITDDGQGWAEMMSGMADVIAKALVELEFEVRRLHPVIPIIQPIRFDFTCETILTVSSNVKASNPRSDPSSSQ